MTLVRQPETAGAATPWLPIRKAGRRFTVEPNLPDYDSARATFSWEAARAELDGLDGGGGLNIAHEAVDRHVSAGRGHVVALRFGGLARMTRSATSPMPNCGT